MLKVQEYLRTNTLEKLVENYKIVVTHHDIEPLVILNYDQIESPKGEALVQECRGLVLHKNDYRVVGRSFFRFFNYGEMLDHTKNFNWSNFQAYTKEDGSLISLYNYMGQWRISTRGSWATHNICEGGPTWEGLFWSLVNYDKVDRTLDKKNTYVFEMCSIYNKVVRTYKEPCLYLLGIFDNHSLYDAHSSVVEYCAKALNVKHPDIFTFDGPNSINEFLSSPSIDSTFEGFVLKDDKNMRLKIKNPRYVVLHNLKGNNNNLFLAKNMVPLIMSGEYSEVLTYFEEARERYDKAKILLDSELSNLCNVWERAKNIEKQKDFAQYILDKTALASILFECRKFQKEPAELWKRSQDRIIKFVEGKL